jgi:hypothetical protein
VSTTLRKREGAVKVVASYTWSKLTGNVNNTESNDLGSNPARDLYYQYGYLPADYRHDVRGTFTWQLNKIVSLGYTGGYRSGYPYQRLFRNEVEGGAVDRRSPIGTNPGGNINDPGDDRPLRLPDILDMSAQVRVNLKPLVGINLDGFVDVLNLLALRTTTSLVQEDGPAWGQPAGGRLGPMRLRLGFRARF